MTGLTAAAIALGLGVALREWRQAEIQRALASRKAEEALHSARDARSQQERAERGFRQLQGALDQFFTQVSESNLLNQPGLQPLRKTLLQSALEKYQEILTQWGDDPGIRVDLGKARLRLALVTGEIDSWPKAIALMERARDAFRELGRAGDAPEYASLLAKSDNGLGVLYAATGRLPEAEAILREALAVLERLARDRPSDPDARRDLARTRHNLGRLAHSLGRKPEAEACYKAALEVERQLACDHPSDPDAWRDLAKTLSNLGDVLLNEGKRTEAESSYREALRLRAELVDDQPLPFARNDLANSLASLGVLHFADGRSTEAEAAYRRAIALWESLVESNPAVTQFRRNLAAACNNLGVLYNGARRFGEAEAPFRRALELEERLARDDPNELYREEMAASRNNLGLVLASSGRGRESGEQFEGSLKIRERLARDHPDSPSRRRDLAATYSNLGFHHRVEGRSAEAVEAYRKALDCRRRLLAGDPGDFHYRGDLAGDLGDLALTHRLAGQARPAEEAYREALALREGLGRDRPDDPEDRRRIAAIHHGLGLVHRDTGATDEARVEFGQALAIRARLAERFPDDAEVRAGLASTRDGLAALDAKAGRLADAEVHYEEALALRKRLAEGRPDDLELRRALAATHNHLGTLYVAARRAREAEEAFLQAREATARLVAERPDGPDAVDLGGYETNLADQYGRDGSTKAALEAYDRAISTLERALGREAGSPGTRDFLRNAYWGRAEILARQGRREPALEDWRRAIGADPGPLRAAIRVDYALALARWGRRPQALAEADALSGEASLTPAALVGLARVYSLNAAVVPQDRAPGGPEGRRDSERHAARAIELLEMARAGHFFDDPARVRALKDDPDLELIRDRRGFRAFLARLDHPAAPGGPTGQDRAPAGSRPGGVLDRAAGPSLHPPSSPRATR